MLHKPWPLAVLYLMILACNCVSAKHDEVIFMLVVPLLSEEGVPSTGPRQKCISPSTSGRYNLGRARRSGQSPQHLIVLMLKELLWAETVSLNCQQLTATKQALVHLFGVKEFVFNTECNHNICILMSKCIKPTGLHICNKDFFLKENSSLTSTFSHIITRSVPAYELDHCFIITCPVSAVVHEEFLDFPA